MKVLKISAIWCPSCIIMTNTVNNLKNEYPDLEWINYDYDMDEEIVKKYEIGNILPVLIFMDENGKEIKRITGEKSKKELKDIIESLD